MTKLNIGKLFTQLNRSKRVAELGGRIMPGLRYGIIVAQGERSLGLWSVRNGAFVFRELANYEPVLTATDCEEAYQSTVQLLADCQHGWAERRRVA